MDKAIARPSSTSAESWQEIQVPLSIVQFFVIKFSSFFASAMDSSALYGKQSTENHGRLSLFGQSACPYSTYRFIFQTYFVEFFKLRLIMSTNQKHGTCGIVSKLERFQNLHFSQSLLQMKSIPKRIKKLNSLFLMLLSFKYSDDVSYRPRYVVRDILARIWRMGKGGRLKINFKRALLWCMRFLRRRITVLYGDNLPLPIKRLVKSEPMKRRSRSRSFSNKIRKSKSGRVSPRLLKRQTSNQARIFKIDLCRVIRSVHGTLTKASPISQCLITQMSTPWLMESMKLRSESMTQNRRLVKTGIPEPGQASDTRVLNAFGIPEWRNLWRHRMERYHQAQHRSFTPIYR